MKSDLAAVGVDLTSRQLRVARRSGTKGKSTDASKRQDIFVFYWYPDYADPYSWFINLFHSASPPYFNLSYLASKPIDSSIDTLPGDDRDEPCEGRTPTTSACRSRCSAQAVAVPLYVQNYQRLYRKSMHRLRRQPGVLQRRVRLRRCKPA